MSDKKKIKRYIKNQTEFGYSKEDIEKALLEAGWSRKSVDNAFNSLNKKTTTPNREKINKKLIVVGVFALLILSFSVFGAFYALNQNEEADQETNQPEMAEQEKVESEEEEKNSQKEELSVNFPYVLLKFDKIAGSNTEDLYLVSETDEKSVATGTNRGKIKVKENKVIIVGAIDTSRDFGWTAVIVNSDKGIINQENGYVNDLNVTLNPLSTAVQMVFISPGVFQTDLEKAKTILSEIEKTSEVISLSKKLEDNANQKSPLDIPEVSEAYQKAIEASVEKLNSQEEGQFKLPEDRSEGMEMYKNKEMNFSIKYPPDFDYGVWTEKYNEAPYEFKTIFTMSVRHKEGSFPVCQKQEPPINFSIMIRVFKNKDELSAKEWFDKKREQATKVNTFFAYKGIEPEKKFKVNGEEALKFGISKGTPPGGGRVPGLGVFAKDNKIYLIDYNTPYVLLPSKDCQQKIEEIFNNVIESFEFVK